MAATRKARVPMTEQIRLINECRKSGMTDADWCRENDICLSTFYNWISRCRKAAAGQIPLHQTMAIMRNRFQSKLWFPSTLFRILFRTKCGITNVTSAP